MTKLVCIEKYWSAPEAYLAKAELENAGVVAKVTGTSVNSVFGEIAGQLSPIELMVHECNVEEARVLLREISGKEGLPDQVEWKCAECGEISPGSFATCWSCGSDNRAELPIDTQQRVDTTPVDDFAPHRSLRIDANSHTAHDANPYLIQQLPERLTKTIRDEESQSEATEKAIERAWRAAIIGLFVPITFCSFYSLYLLLRYGTKSNQVSSKHNAMFLASLLISVVVAGATIAALNFFFA